MILLEENEIREDMERIILEVGRVGIIKVKDLIFIVFIVEKIDMKQRHVGSHGTRSRKSRIKSNIKVKLLSSCSFCCFPLQYWHK